MTMDFSEFEEEEAAELSGKRLSRDDLHDLAKLGGDLFRKTILSGFEMFRDASKDLPKEATQFITARKEQVLRNMSRDLAQVMINTAFENFFSLVRQHRLDVSIRIVRVTDRGAESGAAAERAQAKGKRTVSKGASGKSHFGAAAGRPGSRTSRGRGRTKGKKATRE